MWAPGLALFFFFLGRLLLSEVLLTVLLAEAPHVVVVLVAPGVVMGSPAVVLASPGVLRGSLEVALGDPRANGPAAPLGAYAPSVTAGPSVPSLAGGPAWLLEAFVPRLVVRDPRRVLLRKAGVIS